MAIADGHVHCCCRSLCPASPSNHSKQAPAPAAPPAAGPGTVGRQQPWTASATKDGAVVGVQLDEKQIEALRKVSTYFNGLKNLKGAFVQTTAENKRMRGQFYVKQPGRFRFDYSRPSRQIIISDGAQIAIQDTDAVTDDRLTLEQTPMRVLLRKDVDLLRDARIYDVQETPRPHYRRFAGQVRRHQRPHSPVHDQRATEVELKEWVTTDAQGLDTKLEVANLVRTEEIDPKLFQIESIALKKLMKPQ